MADNVIRVETYEREVTQEIREALLAFLEEAGAEVESQAAMNSPVAEGQLKGNWGHAVDDGELKVTIGNTTQHAIWMEFGTGEYALEGKGRKGGWYIPIGSGAGSVDMATVEKYNWPIRYGKDGQAFAYTKGARPRRMLYNAMQDMAGAVQSRANEIIGGRLDGD